MSKSKKKNDKSLSAGKKFLAILLLSCSLVGVAVSAGFAVIDACFLYITAISGIIAFITLRILLEDKITAKEKTSVWYLDKYLAALVPVWVISATVFIATGYDENEMIMYTGFLMFPAISILIAPNAALYALRDSKGWQRIFYDKGNLERFKDTKDFYRIDEPVSFEKRLLLAVVKDQILNISAVISLLFIGALGGLIRILNDGSRSVSSGDLFGAIRCVRLQRETGVMAFILLIAAVFGFPIFVYYVTNAIYKLRIIKKHEYIAYHAIVKYVHSYKMRIDCDGRKYEYNYSTLVGMRESKVNDTPAVLIFIPDDVLIFPDEII